MSYEWNEPSVESIEICILGIEFFGFFIGVFFDQKILTIFLKKYITDIASETIIHRCTDKDCYKRDNESEKRIHGTLCSIDTDSQEGYLRRKRDHR